MPSRFQKGHCMQVLHAINVILIECAISLLAIPKCHKNVYVNSSVPRTAKLWNSLPIECYPLNYDLTEKVVIWSSNV